MTKGLSAERLAEIAERLAALPAGEWSADVGLPFNVVSTATMGWTPGREGYYDDEDEQAALDAEARFMAAAPTDIAALLAEVEALREALRTITHGCGEGFSEDGINAEGIPFGHWERGFMDCYRVIEARVRAALAAAEATP